MANTYDVNGNLTADPYKNLALEYNVLNRTDKISLLATTGRQIEYIYDAGGSLLRKIATAATGGAVTTTDYIDGFVYINTTLSYFSMPEGRVVNYSGKLMPEYTISDQQGNARVSFNNTGTGNTAKVIQENSFYGFGMVMPGSLVTAPPVLNKKLYNGGSEMQNDFVDLPNYYQTFFRNYDAALGRWIGVDPDPESAESLTGYQYAGNNPIMFNDPWGDKLNTDYTPPGENWRDVNGVAAMGDRLMTQAIADNDAAFAQYLREQSAGGKYFDFWNSLFSTGADFYSFRNGYNEAKGGSNNGLYTYIDQDGSYSFQLSPNSNSALAIQGDKGYTFYDNPGGKKANQGGGATVYIEHHGLGHAYFEVNGTVFSYGRYDGSYTPQLGTYGPVGDGVLYRYTGNEAKAFISDRMKKDPATVFNFPKANADAMFNYMNKLYNSGVPGKNGGMHINTYVLIGSNCTTITCDALQVGGVAIPTIQSPNMFYNYMTNPLPTVDFSRYYINSFGQQ